MRSREPVRLLVPDVGPIEPRESDGLARRRASGVAHRNVASAPRGQYRGWAHVARSCLPSHHGPSALANVPPATEDVTSDDDSDETGELGRKGTSWLRPCY